MSLENLTPFQPGQSGNPKGKPKGARNRSTILREILALQAKKVNLKSFELPDGATYEDAINLKLADIALEGDLSAIKEIQDTLHGKIIDKVHTEHSFTQMGRVSAAPLEAIEGKAELVSISFDVGEDARKLPDQT